MLITRGSSVRSGVGPSDLLKDKKVLRKLKCSLGLHFLTLPQDQIYFANLGGVAQLGEHLICIQEVRGSIPLASILFFDNYIAKIS